jgi:acyl carrier protein
MDASVEPRVRQILADVLGIDFDLVTSDVCLADDLAADSLDMVEVCIALEETFGLSLPHGLPGWVRTCGQLVTFVHAARPVPPPMLVVTVAPKGDGGPPPFVRSVHLTPYDLDAIVDDAASFASGTAIDVAVEGADGTALATLSARFTRLVERGLIVHIHRLGQLGSHPHAA